ncbi:hypothetical protein KAR29_13125 [Aminithiophilus ramosus]|uniref:Uncharacterized protein n=2 Tax=Synergistales TaxID=649776 RepID=A0A9Q7EVT8_9BACT|nr:hypothetical protein [Aminithiophilus ramosus]QTX32229.1 hypothetical protein KAR29_13125 [Aminithiophilus ramosus]QVL36097.1 hypothetical protein KIH16_13325 [Synergistota bacterium]
MRRLVARGTLALLLLPFLSLSAGALSEADLSRIWRNNGSVEGIQIFRFGLVDWSGRSASVEGAVPLRDSSAQARLLARQGASLEAKKRLLLLLYEIRYGLPERLRSIDVSGSVVEGHVDFAGVREGRYVLEVTLPLERLFDECVLFEAVVR